MREYYNNYNENLLVISSILAQCVNDSLEVISVVDSYYDKKHQQQSYQHLMRKTITQTNN
jgi:hypothetical protein